MSQFEPYQFTITADHLKLLKRMYVRWDDSEYGAPTIDSKRPYGNSQVEEDICEILGYEAPHDADGVIEYTPEQYAYAQAIHREMQQVLQIVLATSTAQPGKYMAERFTNAWQRVP